MQPCKTGDQLYSDASPNGECSLGKALLRGNVILPYDFYFNIFILRTLECIKMVQNMVYETMNKLRCSVLPECRSCGFTAKNLWHLQSVVMLCWNNAL